MATDPKTIHQVTNPFDGYVNTYDSYGQSVENKIVNLGLTPLPAPVITGLKLKADVILGDLVLNTIDANNVVWVCTGIDGWWEQPDPEMPDLPRGLGDGSYDVRGRWQARQITLKGSFFCTDPSYVAAARDTLIRATSLVYTGAWLKTNENPTRACYVRLSGKPNIETTGARGRTDFSIGLRAADPVKYEWKTSDTEGTGYTIATIPAKSTSPSHSGTSTITNIGNTEVTAIFDVQGPLTGPATLQNTTTQDLILIINSLREGATSTVSGKALTSNIATITTTSAHNLLAGDLVTIAGVDTTFNGDQTVVDVPTTTSFTFNLIHANVTSATSTGTVTRDPDHLEIDTYEHSVALNGDTYGARSNIDTLVDWIKLAPGDNVISLIDEGNANSTASVSVYYRSGWIG